MSHEGRQRFRQWLEATRLALVLTWLRATARRQRAAVVDVQGRPLLVLPGVFPPDSFTTALVLRNRHFLVGRDVLEIGCGAGALAVLSAGLVRSMTVTDLNPAAVKNTRLNLAWHDVEGVVVEQGDLFGAVQGRFDVVVFNAPFFPGRPRDTVERNWLSDAGALLDRFLAAAPDHLRPGAEIWLTHADIANEESFHRRIASHGFGWEVLDRRTILIETFKLYRLLRAASEAYTPHG